MPKALDSPKFLIIDDNADSRTFLRRTLLRKYPGAVVVECHTGDTAIAMLRAERLSAVVAHRTFDYDGETLIQVLRQADPKVAIVMVSGADKRAVARKAGADAFMPFDAWLTIGSVVADSIAARQKANEIGAGAHFDSPEPEAV